MFSSILFFDLDNLNIFCANLLHLYLKCFCNVQNFSDLFVKCLQQVTKGHLYHLIVVSDYYVMYRQRAQSVL